MVHDWWAAHRLEFYVSGGCLLLVAAVAVYLLVEGVRELWRRFRK